MAAKFEFEVNESIETARMLFQRALRLLPSHNKLWIEVYIFLFKLSFSYLEKNFYYLTK